MWAGAGVRETQACPRTLRREPGISTSTLSVHGESQGPVHLPVCEGAAPHGQCGQSRRAPAASGDRERQGEVGDVAPAGLGCRDAPVGRTVLREARGAVATPSRLHQVPPRWGIPGVVTAHVSSLLPSGEQNPDLGGARQSGPQARRVGRVPGSQPLLPPVRPRQGEEAGAAEERYPGRASEPRAVAGQGRLHGARWAGLPPEAGVQVCAPVLEPSSVGPEGRGDVKVGPSVGRWASRECGGSSLQQLWSRGHEGHRDVPGPTWQGSVCTASPGSPAGCGVSPPLPGRECPYVVR